MASTPVHRRWHIIVCTAIVVAATIVPGSAASGAGIHRDHGRNDEQPVLFFVADGMRQDLIERLVQAQHNRMPAMSRLLKSGVSASGGGLLTQAPPNTGAGWYSLATGAWPGVTGSTNNTFHINGQPFANRTAAFDAGVLKAESIAQSAERGGKKVVQFEFAGGRVAEHAGSDGRFPELLLRVAAWRRTTSLDR